MELESKPRGLGRLVRDQQGFGPHFNSVYAVALGIGLFVSMKVPLLHEWRMQTPFDADDLVMVEEASPSTDRLEAGPWSFEPEASGAMVGRWRATTGSSVGGWIAFGLLVLTCAFMHAELGALGIGAGLIFGGGALAVQLWTGRAEAQCRISREGVTLVSPLGTRDLPAERIGRIGVDDEKVGVVVTPPGGRSLGLEAADAPRARALAAAWRGALLPPQKPAAAPPLGGDRPGPSPAAAAQ